MSRGWWCECAKCIPESRRPVTPATDLGFLLHKHPEHVHSREFPFGNATVFYPEATADAWRRPSYSTSIQSGWSEAAAARAARRDQYVNDHANALVRVLMETTVAIMFILQKSSQRRALVFHAYGIAQSLKMLTEWKTTPGLKRQVTKAALAQASAGVAFYANKLPTGTDFKRHWSGTGSLKEALKSLRGDAMYSTLYRFTSSISHGADFGGHFEVDPSTDNFAWQIEPTVRGFEAPTYAARQLLWMAAHRIDERLGLGFAAQLTPHKLTRAQVMAGER